MRVTPKSQDLKVTFIVFVFRLMAQPYIDKFHTIVAGVASLAVF